MINIKYLYSKIILNQIQITHFGIHNPGNAGDTVLFKETRNLFNYVNPNLSWRKKSVRSLLTAKSVKTINSNRTPVIIGGGGLFLSDTNINNNSGWQWNAPINLVKKILSPIAIFGIGYNRFNKQPEFEPIFKEHLSQCVIQSTFFGMRNKGSLEKIKDYIDEELHKKLAFQPCPTTLISLIHDDIKIKLEKEKKISLNIAFDRKKYRYNNNFDTILNRISKAMFELQVKGWLIELVIHSKDDNLIIPYLRNNGVNLKIIDLDKKDYYEIINYYRKTHIVVGMRGHSQMIPFGLNKNIISLISHPKLKYFLDDIGEETWGIDIHRPDLTDSIIHKTNEIGIENYDEVQKSIKLHQKDLFDISLVNTNKILYEFKNYF